MSEEPVRWAPSSVVETVAWIEMDADVYVKVASRPANEYTLIQWRVDKHSPIVSVYMPHDQVLELWHLLTAHLGDGSTLPV